MTRQKKFVKELCFMTTSGVSAIAVVLATLPLFEPTRVEAADRSPVATAVSRPTPRRVAQVQAQVPTQPAAPVTTPIPAQVPAQVPAPANPNQDPFRLGNASAPVANPAVNPNAALATSGSASVAPSAPQIAAPPADQIAQLRARIQTLQTQLRRMPTSLEEQQAQQKTVEEIASLQNQIQQLEVSGQFSNYRQFRQAADAQQAQPTFGAPVPNVLDPNNPLTPFQQSRQQTLDASGLNAASLANRLDPNVQGEVGLLTEQREGLLQQYRQIQQTLRALQPGDQALAEGLKQEQATLLEQLRDVESRLNAAQSNLPKTQNSEGAFNPNDPSVIPPGNRLPNVPESVATNSDLAVRMQKVEQAARLLQEAGLVLLANYALGEAPRMADPNFKETQLVPGAWAEEDGLAESRHNPFQQITGKDIDGINTSIDDLKTRVDSLTETLANVEAQLKLLTRNSVAEPVAAPVVTPSVAPNVPEDEIAPSENIGSDVPAIDEPAPVPTVDVDEIEPTVPETESLPEVNSDDDNLQPAPLVPSPLQ